MKYQIATRASKTQATILHRGNLQAGLYSSGIECLLSLAFQSRGGPDICRGAAGLNREMAATIDERVRIAGIARCRIRGRIAIDLRFVVDAQIAGIEYPLAGVDCAVRGAIELIAPLSGPGDGSGVAVCDAWALDV